MKPDQTNSASAPEPEGEGAVRSSAVLACPFCGEQPEYKPWAQGHAPEYHWPHQVVHNCETLGVQICVRAHKVGQPDTKDSVFSIWNTRAAGLANVQDQAQNPRIGASNREL